MGLVCTPKATIALIFTSYFFGYALGGFAYAFPDRFGRKCCLILGLLLSCIAQTGMIMSHSFVVRSLMFFVMGLR